MSRVSSPMGVPSKINRAAAAAFFIASSGAGLAHAESLTIALSSGINTLDPTQAQVIGTDVSIAAHLYSSLVKRTAQGELVGDLAVSWRAENDKTWVFDLKTDVKFPNGEALDAAVVKWNIDRIRDPATNSRNRAWFAPVTDVEVASPTQIKIHTSTPYPALPAQLAMVFYLQPDWVKSGNNPASQVYGTGPYKLESMIAGDRLSLTAQPNYYGMKPAFDRVVFRTITEAASRVAGIRAGELDLALDIPLEEIDRLNGGKSVAGWKQSNRSMVVRMNTTKPPFLDNVTLRQALNYAVDKKGIVDGLLGGRGNLSACQVVTSDYFGFNADLKPYPYDPAKAKQMIKQAGITGPVNVELQVPTGRYFMASEISQVVAAQLQEVGINATIREYDFSSWVQPYAAGNMGPLVVMGQNWPTLDADGLLTLYTSGNKTGYFANKDFDAAVAEARSTTNEKQRLESYKKATQIMCDQAPVVFLFAQPLTYAFSTRVVWNARGDDWLLASDFKLK